tara:strand:+ start:373 stop:2142 length:1770 start_codon:yes stop_codon:yes gene_type:complete
MKFDTDYWSSLSGQEREVVKLNPTQLGYSLGGDPLKNLKSGIFTGTNTMELTFFNQPGKGQQKGAPESWGRAEREEMKQLARVNEVDVTIHATPNMGPGSGASLSGFTGKSFSHQDRSMALQEINRATDFAADVAGGGPVVFHIDGFPRNVFTAGEGEATGKFEMYPGEEEKGFVSFVDKDTGDVTQIGLDRQVPVPVLRKDKPGEFEKENGKFKIEHKNFNQIENEFKSLSKDEQKYYKKKGIENSPSYFYHRLNEIGIGEMEAKRREYERTAKKHEKQAEETGEIYNSYKNNPQKLKSDFQDPQNALKGMKNQIDQSIDEKKFYEHGVLSLQRQKEEAERSIRNHQEITNHGVAQEASTVAQAAMHAYEVEQKKRLKEPLYVAPENWRIENYGSHPKEYKRLIQESREIMTDSLVREKRMSKSRAKTVAEEHIKGTFDIGHMNMWRKYHKTTDEDYEKWVGKHVRDLVKNNIIGHVHLSDNFGYYDEHLELGEGNTPLQDFFKIMKEEGFKGKMIAEPGGQREDQMHRVWTSALALGASPIYRIDAASKTWTDIEGSYFGRTQSPSFLVGDYAPAKEWTLWSEVPYE